jgi:hypothetical protein
MLVPEFLVAEALVEPREVVVSGDILGVDLDRPLEDGERFL